jgi:ribosomal protein S12 methylthiotransferase
VELAETQEPITAAARRALVGTEVDVLVDGVDDDAVVGRTWREAPEIDGVVRLSDESGAWARPGARVRAVVTDSEGPDLDAMPLPHAPSLALAEVAP